MAISDSVGDSRTVSRDTQGVILHFILGSRDTILESPTEPLIVINAFSWNL